MPRSPSAAAATPCSVNGPWKFAQAVSAVIRLAPLGHDGVALDRGAREAREAERLADDERGARQRLVHVAVVERAVVDARLGLGRGDRVEHRIERLVVDRDELGGVLGHVPVACHDDRERLADVARGRRRRSRSEARESRSRRGTAVTAPARPRGVSTPITPGSLERGAGSTAIRACGSSERTTAA